VAAAGGFALLRRSPHDREPVPGGVAHLDAASYHLFRQLGLVLLPTAGTGLFPADQVPVAEHVDGILEALAPEVRKQLFVGLALFDNAAVFSHGRRLVDLSPEQARAYVESWVDSDSLTQRTLGLVASKLTHTAYWMDARTWPAVEFDGPVSKKWGLVPRGNQPLPA
jgi:hypothetical protein